MTDCLAELIAAMGESGSVQEYPAVPLFVDRALARRLIDELHTLRATERDHQRMYRENTHLRERLGDVELTCLADLDSSAED
jgi:hypothetical protein